MMVFLWWCGWVSVVVLVCFSSRCVLCLCVGVVVCFVAVWLCFCGGAVVFLWWCGCVFLVVFLWWCGGVFVVVRVCFYGCVIVFL